MAAVHGKDTWLYYNYTDRSASCRGFTFTVTPELADETAFRDTNRSRLAGVVGRTLSLETIDVSDGIQDNNYVSNFFGWSWDRTWP